MADAKTSAALDFEPDADELEIAATVIFHRAALLPHQEATRDELLQAADDYLEYARFLKFMSDPSTAFGVRRPNEPTAPEVFYETDQLVGLSQRVSQPSAGVDHRHFRLSSRTDAARSQFRPTPAMARCLAVVELIQHPEGRWQVLHAEVESTHRREGLATLLYDRIEAILAAEIHPSGWLSDDAYRFWQRRGSPVLQYYRAIELFEGMWISPKALLTWRKIAAAKKELIEDAGEP